MRLCWAFPAGILLLVSRVLPALLSGEQEILVLLAKGARNHSIADELGISTKARGQPSFDDLHRRFMHERRFQAGT